MLTARPLKQGIFYQNFKSGARRRVEEGYASDLGQIIRDFVSSKLEVRSQAAMLSTCARVRSDFRKSYSM